MVELGSRHIAVMHVGSAIGMAESWFECHERRLLLPLLSHRQQQRQAWWSASVKLQKQQGHWHQQLMQQQPVMQSLQLYISG